MAKRYDSKPAMSVDPAKQYTATIEMDDGGRIVVDLLPDAAPETVNSFVFLARDGYYDGLGFHRIIPGFVAQGGDPTGDGTGGPGYTIPDEVNDNKHVEGVMAMAKTAAPNSAGSQFYITLGTHPHLDADYTVFGKVRNGMDVVKAFPARNPGSGQPPAPTMKSVSISED